MKISEIIPNEKNPRYIKSEKFKKLVKSIKDFPEMLAVRPIVIDENNMVLGGNMRLKACKEAGIDDVPVQYAKGWSEAQKREFIIKDNVGFGEWDWDVLANQWNEEQLNDWGLEVPAWNDDDDDIDFDNIESNEEREKQTKKIEVTCPHCKGKFDLET